MWFLQPKQQAVVQYVDCGLYQSVAPWLSMLERCRSQDKQAEFEVISRRLHTDFNLLPIPWRPDEKTWDTAGLSLEDYPHIVARLTATWERQACLEYVYGLIKDNGNGSRAGFPLPVFEDVLLLTGLLEARLSHPILEIAKAPLQATLRRYASVPRSNRKVRLA